MISKICGSIAIFDLSRILLFSTFNLLLFVVEVSQVEPVGDDDQLHYAQSPDREGIPQDIWRCPIDLASNNAGRISDTLLHADCRRASIMRREIDIEPRHVQPRAIIHGNGAEKRAKVLDAVGRGAEYEDVAHDTWDIGEEEQRPSDAGPVRYVRKGYEAYSSKDVYWDTEVLCLDRRIPHVDQNRRQEGGETV